MLERLRPAPGAGPLVVAHRGSSRQFPENTLPAFQAARDLGAPVQEFDVQVCGDGTLVCLHDPTLDRTTDAVVVLGPGAMVATTDLATLRRLDAGRWKGPEHRGTAIPTLEEALAAMLPRSIPMIEHKGGTAGAFVAELQRIGRREQVLLQSFDWSFVRAARECDGELVLGLLGPTSEHPLITDEVVAAARSLGCGFVHWAAQLVTREAVDRVHDKGLLLCTYTSDDALSWHGARALGVDAMCTNDPGAMLGSLRRGD